MIPVTSKPMFRETITIPVEAITEKYPFIDHAHGRE